jgi:hypothetical protein
VETPPIRETPHLGRLPVGETPVDSGIVCSFPPFFVGVTARDDVGCAFMIAKDLAPVSGIRPFAIMMNPAATLGSAISKGPGSRRR